jgi:hypothetical protein
LRSPGACEKVAPVNDEKQRETRPILRSRSIAAAVVLLLAGPLAGLGCSREEPRKEPGTASAPLASAPAKPKKKAKAPLAEPSLPEGSFRLEPARVKPGVATVTGWEPSDEKARRVARLAAAKATAEFDLAPAADNYVLTAVARVRGASSAKLSPTLNGKALPAWSLTGDWAMYSSPVPKDLLKSEKDELVFATGALKPPVEIEVDTLALTPVADRALVEMGAATSGLLIDGFHESERNKRWSRGDKSVIGVVLEPRKSPYLLKVRGASFRELGTLETKAIVNGKDIGSAEFKPKFDFVTWQIPAGVLTSGQNRIELVYSKTGKPSKDGKSKDKRDIAVSIARIAVEPGDMKDTKATKKKMKKADAGAE